MTKEHFEEKIVTVTYSGSVKHAAGERHSRFIKGDERNELQKKFHKGPEKPSLVYQAIKAELPGDAMASGNRTGCGVQTTTMRKIASEGRQLTQMDKDITKSLDKIRQKLYEKESARDYPPSPGHGGFVHTICYHPLIVHMWIEDQVRLWHRRCANDVSYLDATGTIVANHNGKRVLYYGLVVRHPNEGDPSVAVAEMLTSDQSTGNIRFFIERFRREESRIFNGRLTAPRQLNTDYSRAILLAVLKEFNNETLQTFFQRAFRILHKRGSEQDFELTIPHVGCSHFMHIVHKKVKQLLRGKEEVWYRFNMYCMSLLVNARNLQEFDAVLEDFAVCLSSKKQNGTSLVAYTKLNERIQNMNKNGEINLKDFETEVEDVTVQRQEDDIVDRTERGNPFSDYFNKKLNDIEMRMDAIQDSENERDNRSYCPQFLVFIKRYVVEMPLWSGVLLGKLDRYREDLGCKALGNIKPPDQFLSFSSANAKSEGYIEGAMRNLKQEDFAGRKRLRADSFVSENYDRIRRRIRDYADRLHNSLVPKKKRTYNKKTKTEHDLIEDRYSRIADSSSSEETYHDAQEKWGKKDPETPKQNPKLGQFQQSPTIPLSTTPDVKKSTDKKKTSIRKTTCKKASGKGNVNADCTAGQESVTREVKCTPKSCFNNEKRRDVESTENNKTYNKKRKQEHNVSDRYSRIGGSSSSEETPHDDTKEKCGHVNNGQETLDRNTAKTGSRKPRRTAKEKRELEKRLTEWIYNRNDTEKEEYNKEELSWKRKDPSSNSSASKRRKVTKVTDSSDDEDVDLTMYVGLVNRQNSCWLNTLIQCINSLPLRTQLVDEIKNKTACKVTSALMQVISKMDHHGLNAAFYPIELYQAMQDEYSFVAGQQQDIQEIFTFMSAPGEQNTNCIIASHFQIGCQHWKMCQECGKCEDGSPETPTSIIVPVLNGIEDLERSIENSMSEHINIHCNGECNTVTDHSRSRKFVFLPQTLVLGFNRFQRKGTTWKKKHSKVQLPLHIQITGNTVCRYDLRACGLHHGQAIHTGHYTAVIFDNCKVIEVDDQHVKDISNDWIGKVTSTVYLAFYTKQSALSLQRNNRPQLGNNTDKRKKDDKKDGSSEYSVRGNSARIHQDVNDSAVNILHCFDVSNKYQSLCSVQTVGYDLSGRNFKTLEYPVMNKSYSLPKPGWLDDCVVDAYLLLLVKACAQKGIRVHALNSFFYTRLQKAMLDVIKGGNDQKNSRHGNKMS
jgi:ubiquitin C-terminal hydrolase